MMPALLALPLQSADCCSQTALVLSLLSSSLPLQRAPSVLVLQTQISSADDDRPMQGAPTLIS